MYTYASPQGLSSPSPTGAAAAAAATAAAAAVHHHHHPHAAVYHHHHHPHMMAPHPPHPYSSAASSPSTVTGINSPSTLGGSGGYLTSPTGSSLQLLSGGSPGHNGSHALLGLGGPSAGVIGPSGTSHLVGGLPGDHQVNHMAAGGSGGVVMGPPSYDGSEMVELKKRRYTFRYRGARERVVFQFPGAGTLRGSN